MFDLGWAELSFLAVLALIIVGPKDLPKLARGAGKLWSRIQRLYRHSLQSITRLENEIELASGPDQRRAPSHYDLLPEHVRRTMETTEPSRDPEQARKADEMYRQAMNELREKQQKEAETNEQGE
ncbi:Sec-independent protein translocase subunit TatA/TatB [Marinimicrobium agarilyticum]|uniref:Sec-independent protein translocase subunit TatA/TatB n=1 Tax=Marinimicrobium agarilyticum TaxID=306546 RepID=UPI00041B61CB|nr:twin-arginine translocase TatA/TatE family subunit [Marinimicrobium agarilyticum]